MAWKWYDSHIIKIEQAGPITKRFWVKINSEEIFDFEPGQFVTMDLPIHEKRLKRWRSYSIANAPDQTNILEFCIVQLEEGAGSTYLFNAAVGTSIRFKGADGGFVLPKDLDRELIMVCTGTGVAPFRSMLHTIQNKSLSHRKIHLIFGTREEAGILYREEFEDLARSMPNFSYSVTLSREANWEGWKGHVHQVYMDAYKEVDPNRHFYLCGWSQMIDEAVEKIIITLGYDKSQVHYELYG